MRRPFFTQLLSATFIAALLGATGPASAGTLHGDVGRGSSLAHQWCSSCHLLTGEKRAGDVAPPFREIARDPKMGPDEWRALLSRPHGPMPPITLSRQEIEDLVAYLSYLKEN
jgi:mono/diheme cytochrome c family protein